MHPNPANPPSSLDPKPSGPHWFEDSGLCFTCTQCGHCCRGEEGAVWVTDADLQRLAQYLEMDPGDFQKRHMRRLQGRWSLRERANGDCEFFDSQEMGCRVYTARPGHCRTWPFWREYVQSKESWKTVCSACPGAGRGRNFSWAEILEQVEQQEQIRTSSKVVLTDPLHFTGAKEKVIC